MISSASTSTTPPATSAPISADGTPSTHRVTAYANVENALDRRYNEVVGYPALPINFRAGFRFRIGGE